MNSWQDLGASQLVDEPSAVDFDHTTERLWCANRRGALAAFELPSMELVCAVKGHDGPVLRMSSCSEGVLSVSNSVVRLHSAGGVLLRHVTPDVLPKASDVDASAPSATICAAQPLFVNQSTFVPSAGLVAVGGTGLRSVAQLDLTQQFTQSLALHPDENLRSKLPQPLATVPVTHPVHLLCSRIPESSQMAALSGVDGLITILDPLFRSPLPITSLTGHAGGVVDADIRGSYLATIGRLKGGGPDPTLRVFDLRMRRLLHSIQLPTERSFGPTDPMLWPGDASAQNKKAPYFLRYRPGSATEALVVSGDGQLHAVDTSHGFGLAQTHRLQSLRSGMGGVAPPIKFAAASVAPSGSLVAIAHESTDAGQMAVSPWMDDPSRRVARVNLMRHVSRAEDFSEPAQASLFGLPPLKGVPRHGCPHPVSEVDAPGLATTVRIDERPEDTHWGNPDRASSFPKSLDKVVLRDRPRSSVNPVLERLLEDPEATMPGGAQPPKDAAGNGYLRADILQVRPNTSIFGKDTRSRAVYVDRDPRRCTKQQLYAALHAFDEDQRSANEADGMSGQAYGEGFPSSHALSSYVGEPSLSRGSRHRGRRPLRTALDRRFREADAVVRDAPAEGILHDPGAEEGREDGAESFLDDNNDADEEEEEEEEAADETGAEEEDDEDGEGVRDDGMGVSLQPAARGLSQSMGAMHLTSTSSRVPRAFRPPRVKFRKFGRSDFDFGRHNSTPFPGMEEVGPNSFCIPLLQMLYHCVPLRRATQRHLSSSPRCLATELRFLFDLLDGASTRDPACRVVAPANFVRSRRQQPEAHQLTLLDPSPLPPLRRLRAFANFFLHKIGQDLTGGSDDALAGSGSGGGRSARSPAQEAAQWKRHAVDAIQLDMEDATQPLSSVSVRTPAEGVIQRRPFRAFQLPLQSPGPIPPSSLANLLSRSLASEQRTRGWSPSANQTTALLKRTRVRALPPFLLAWANVRDGDQADTWRTAVKKRGASWATPLVETDLLGSRGPSATPLDPAMLQPQRDASSAAPASGSPTNASRGRSGSAASGGGGGSSSGGDVAESTKEPVGVADGRIVRRRYQLVGVVGHVNLSHQQELPFQAPVGEGEFSEPRSPSGRDPGFPSSPSRSPSSTSSGMSGEDLPPNLQVQSHFVVALLVQKDSGGTAFPLPTSSPTEARVTTPEEYRERRQGSEWLLFNDFRVTRLTEAELLRDTLAQDWFTPAMFLWAALDTHPLDNLAPLLLPRVPSSPVPLTVFQWDTRVTQGAQQDPFTGEIKPIPRASAPPPPASIPRKGELVAIDAEFVGVSLPVTRIRANGRREILQPMRLAPGRVSVLLADGSVLFDDYITEVEPVVDHLTRFSGLQQGELNPQISSRPLVPLRAVYLKLRALVDEGCVFVGHGLDNDFSTLNIHVPERQIRDTVKLFQLPRQRQLALRFLAGHLLGQDIQGSMHDSIEDARTALRLFLRYEELSREGSLQKRLHDLYAQGRASGWMIRDVLRRAEDHDQDLDTDQDDSGTPWSGMGPDLRAGGPASASGWPGLIRVPGSGGHAAPAQHPHYPHHGGSLPASPVVMMGHGRGRGRGAPIWNAGPHHHHSGNQWSR